MVELIIATYGFPVAIGGPQNHCVLHKGDGYLYNVPIDFNYKRGFIAIQIQINNRI